MCAPQTVHVFVEVHHLEPIELVRNLLDLLLLARLNSFHALSIPLDVFAWRGLVLASSLDGAAGDLSIVYVCDFVVRDWAGHDLTVAHCDFEFE